MKKKTIVTISALYLSFVGIGDSAFAQKLEVAQNNIFRLGEIVVKDTTGVQDIAISNTITREEIQSVGATTAAEALKYVPGVNVVQTTKGELNINVQGFAQKDILVLIDGVPYYETENGPLDLQQIPASIIGKIEVTKGASSVLYGPNALGGVVNIITQKGVEGFTGNASVELGDGEYNRDTATINYGHENGFSVLGTVDYRTRDHFSFSDDYEAQPTKIKGMSGTHIVDNGGDKENSDLDSLNLWTRLGYTPTDNAEIYASLYRYELERGRPLSDNHNKRFYESSKGAAFSTFGRYDSYEDTGVDLGGKVKANDWLILRGIAFYHKHQDEYVSYEDWNIENKLATSNWDDDSAGASLFTDMDLEKIGNLSLSAQYRADQHKQRGDFHHPWAESESSIITFAAEDTIKFNQFTAVAGVAYNYFDADKIDDQSGYDTDTMDPMFGLTWTGESGFEVFGSIAKKTRFPAFNDMELNNVVYSLDPEQNINYTLGTKYTFFGISDVTLSGFYNDISGRIAESVDAAGNDIMTNLDEVEIYGGELTTDTSITDRLQLGLDYVYTYARNTSDNRYSDYIEDIPENQGIARVSYLIPTIESTINVFGNVKIDTVIDNESDTMEDSVVIDLSLLKEFENGLSLGGYIYNLFDKDFYEGNGMASNGINFKLLVQYNF